MYLKRPWFRTGFREKLGVIVRDARYEPDGNQFYVSRIGWDPLAIPLAALNPKAITDLTAMNFGEAGKSASVVRLQEAPPQSDPLTPDKPFQSVSPVQVVPYDVKYDEQRQLWYADITFTDLDSIFGKGVHIYRPFVHLALVRYQPHCVVPAGYVPAQGDTPPELNMLSLVSVSKVVMLPHTSILPTRAVTITFRSSESAQTTRKH